MNQVFPSLLTIETFIVFVHEHKDKIKSIYVVIRKGLIWTIKWAQKDIDSSLQYLACRRHSLTRDLFPNYGERNKFGSPAKEYLSFAWHRQKQ